VVKEDKMHYDRSIGIRAAEQYLFNLGLKAMKRERRNKQIRDVLSFMLVLLALIMLI